MRWPACFPRVVHGASPGPFGSQNLRPTFAFNWNILELTPKQIAAIVVSLLPSSGVLMRLLRPWDPGPLLARGWLREAWPVDWPREGRILRTGETMSKAGPSSTWWYWLVGCVRACMSFRLSLQNGERTVCFLVSECAEGQVCVSPQ